MRNYLEFIERTDEGVEVTERYELFQHSIGSALWRVATDDTGCPSIRFYTEGGVEVRKKLGGLVWRLSIDSKATTRPIGITRRDRQQEGV